MTATIMRLKPARLVGHIVERWERPPGEDHYELAEHRWFLAMPGAVAWALPRGPILFDIGVGPGGALLAAPPVQNPGMDDLDREALGIALRVALDHATAFELHHYRGVWTGLLEDLA